MPLPLNSKLKDLEQSQGDERTARFCKSLDDGLCELRCSLVQAFAKEVDTAPVSNGNHLQKSPWIVDGRYHVPLETSPCVAPPQEASIVGLGHGFSGLLEKYRCLERGHFESENTVNTLESQEKTVPPTPVKEIIVPTTNDEKAKMVDLAHSPADAMVHMPTTGRTKSGRPLKRNLSLQGQFKELTGEKVDAVEETEAHVHWRRMIRKSYGRAKHYEPLTKKSKSDMLKNMRPLEKLIHSYQYEMCTLVLVLVNTVQLAWQVQYFATQHREVLDEAETFFTVAFTVDLVLRCLGERRLFLFGADVYWNLFDLFLVVTMWAEFTMQLLVDNTSAQLESVSMFRVMRLLRIFRVMRILRVLKFVRQLRIMISGLLNTMLSLMWTMVLLSLLFFIFGMVLTQGATDHCKDHNWCQDAEFALLHRKFGTLDASMLSLYETMASGISWGELVDVLDPIHRIYTGVFLVFTSIAILAVLNVVTGIFVENALANAQQDRDMLIAEALRIKEQCVDQIYKVFWELDTEKGGALTLEQFMQGIEDVRMVAYFEGLGLDVTDAKALFVLLDRDQQGSVDIEEFLVGCLRMKGEAKSVDMAKLLYESEWVIHSLENITSDVATLCQHLGVQQLHEHANDRINSDVLTY